IKTSYLQNGHFTGEGKNCAFIGSQWNQTSFRVSFGPFSVKFPRDNSRDWEVVTDLPPHVGAPGVFVEKNSIPGVCEGFLMKKRKYPLQGWHKLTRGKEHGFMDVSLAVMSVNKKSSRIDLDAGHNLYHLKTKNHEMFYIWLTKLTAHRMYKKNEAMYIHQGILQALSAGNGSSLPAMASLAQRNMAMMDMVSGVHDIFHQTSQGRLARCELDLAELSRLIQRLHWLEGDLPITDSDLEHRISMHVRPLYCVVSVGLNCLSASTPGLGASLQSIPDYVYTQLSTPGVTSPEGKKLQQEISTVSQRVHASLKSVHEVLSLERERLRQAWTAPDLRQSTTDQLATLCTTLSELEVQSRLTKVHSLSLSSDSTEESFCTVRQDQVSLSNTHSLPAKYAKRCRCGSSASLTTTSLSIAAALSRQYRASVSNAHDVPSAAPKETGRRTVLPGRCTDNSHIGILSILYNNIGKDLSRVSMPVALNEPLNFLQRVSEELEYPELLDIANHTDDPYQRMVYVAVFSISGYAWASWRNRYKPFNPVLGETYESVREDRGFRYVAEQVSHHPPVSACHAESENFTFWQDQRWKNKFWGKSVEIVSTGMVNVTLPRYGDHYEWNKAVTCIHSVFSQQRWLEHYGDVVIRNLKNDICTCKMTFLKSRYGGGESSKNEVQGVVLDKAGTVVHRFGGSWHEGIFCDTLPNPQCIWKPNVQPEDHYEYYGFSQYAREQNELTPELRPLLPPTDTRFRPDQRLLEEGKVAEADKRKDEVEEKQRERRKELAKRGEEHIPRFFRKTQDDAGREVWVSNGTYWKIRENPGFANTTNLDLW
uniref:Oxysterol-binding protein n=1 Tax=Pygocentrus nattereri TaxID=42514 RepID=A0A3B4BPB8_PYGNA